MIYIDFRHTLHRLWWFPIRMKYSRGKIRNGQSDYLSLKPNFQYFSSLISLMFSLLLALENFQNFSHTNLITISCFEPLPISGLKELISQIDRTNEKKIHWYHSVTISSIIYLQYQVGNLIKLGKPTLIIIMG